MKILTSSKAFKEKYTKHVLRVGAVAAGVATTSCVAGTAATAVGFAATQASAWTLGSSLPLIGSWCAGHATMAGIAAGTSALGSVVVLGPALLVGGVACWIYRNSQKQSLQKGSPVEGLAHAFASVAFLPMLALAVSVCRNNPSNLSAVSEYIHNAMGAWGYSEPYVRDVFDNAMRQSPEELGSRYNEAMCRLASGSTDGIGATPQELPYEEVQKFAEDFRNEFESCLSI